MASDRYQIKYVYHDAFGKRALITPRWSRKSSTIAWRWAIP
jgi:hypothetical protein